MPAREPMGAGSPTSLSQLSASTLCLNSQRLSKHMLLVGGRLEWGRDRRLLGNLLVLVLVLLGWAALNYGVLRMLALPQLVVQLTKQRLLQHSGESTDDYNKRISQAAGVVYSNMAVCRSICEFSSQYIWGRLSDKRGRRLATALSLWGLAAGTAVAGLGALHMRMWIVWVGVVIMGLADSVFTQGTALICDLSPADRDLPHRMGLVGLSVGLGAASGAYIWGNVLGHIALHDAFFVAAAAVSALPPLLMLLRPTQGHLPAEDGQLPEPVNPSLLLEQHKHKASIPSTTPYGSILHPDSSLKPHLAEGGTPKPPPAPTLCERALVGGVAFGMAGAVESFFVLFFLAMRSIPSSSGSGIIFTFTHISNMVSVYGLTSAVIQGTLVRFLAFQPAKVATLGLVLMVAGFVSLAAVDASRPACAMVGCVVLALGVGVAQPAVFAMWAELSRRGGHVWRRGAGGGRTAEAAAVAHHDRPTPEYLVEAAALPLYPYQDHDSASHATPSSRSVSPSLPGEHGGDGVHMATLRGISICAELYGQKTSSAIFSASPARQHGMVWLVSAALAALSAILSACLACRRQHCSLPTNHP